MSQPRDILTELVPQTYGEAVKRYRADILGCEPHEWDNRTTLENAEYLINRLYAMAFFVCPVKLDPVSYDDWEPKRDDDGMLTFHLIKYPGFDTHEFSGKTFEIAFALDDPNGHGWCSEPDDPEPLLWLSDKLRGTHLAEVAMHEGLHASLPELSESRVQQVAHDVTSFVWRVVHFQSEGKI